MLVAVLHLDRVARHLRFTRSGEVALILLSRVDSVRHPTRCLPLARQSSHVWVHLVSLLEPRHGRQDGTMVSKTRAWPSDKRRVGASPFGNDGASAPHDAPPIGGIRVPEPQEVAYPNQSLVPQISIIRTEDNVRRRPGRPTPRFPSAYS